MGKSSLSVVFSAGRVFLPVLFIAVLFCSPASAVGVTDAGVNQMISVQTPASPLDQQGSPKKLWMKYGKAYAPNFYAQVYRFTVTPGQKYTLYGTFPPDGSYRNLYATGENPLTDYTYSLDSKGDMTGFVFWFQQPGKWQCPAVARRVNITISPRSEHRYLYLVATSKAPLQSFQVLLKGPADPDNDVEKSTVDPSCPAKKGQTWGQVWGNPILLRNDPVEQGKTPAVPPAPVNPPLPLPPTPQPEPKPGPTGKGIWIEAEKESSHQVADSKTSLKLGPGNHSTTSGYWYLATGGDWLMYQVEIQQAGTYFLWVKDYNDRKHPVESRTVDILVDGKKAASLAAADNPGKENWGWHIASMVELSAGNHILMVKKQATTPAAALIDAFYLTPDPSDRPSP